MRISTEHAERLQSLLTQRLRESAEGEQSVVSARAKGVEGDALHVSSEAALAAKLKELANEAEETDQARVDQVKDQVRAGTYRPSAKAVAEAMLTELEE